MQKAYELHGTSFLHDGSTLPAYSKGPTYSGRFNEAISPEAELPPFADVEFKCHMPLGCCPSEVLYALLASHGCSMLDNDKQSTLEAKVLELKDGLVVPPSKVVPQIAKWQVYEVLMPMDEEPWEDEWWNVATDKSNALLDLIEADHCAHFYWCGDKNVREQAIHLIEGGNFDVQMMQYQKCVSSKDGSKKLVF